MASGPAPTPLSGPWPLSPKLATLARGDTCEHEGGRMADEQAGSPTMLRITFEIEVPKGLRRNIQFTRISKAVAQIKKAVEVEVRTSFPWANRIIVRPAYSYAWWNPARKRSPCRTPMR